MMKIEEQRTLKFERGTKRTKRGTFTLRLTSLIDMFTILLIFLLKSYSAEGQIMSIANDLRLPESTSKIAPKTTSVVAITREWILVDGRPVERLDNIAAGDSLVISPLKQELLKLRRMSEDIGQLSRDMGGFRGDIAIQGDRDMTFNVLKRIMLTCGQVGYNNMHLAVLQEE